MEIVHQVASEAEIESALNKYYGADKKSIETDSRFKDVVEELTRELEQNVEDDVARRAHLVHAADDLTHGRPRELAFLSTAEPGRRAGREDMADRK